jgi:hypothetical protein
MNQPGPIIEALTRRLAETPADFLDEPRIGNSGSVFVAALVNDALRMLGNGSTGVGLEYFDDTTTKGDRNRLALTMIVVWLMTDEWFVKRTVSQEQALQVLTEAVTELAATTTAQKFVSDPDRREELARVVLARLDYRPEGETLAQAKDRLSSISGMERHRLEQASRASEQRASAIREALAKKAAEQAADKWTRE